MTILDFAVWTWHHVLHAVVAVNLWLHFLHYRKATKMSATITPAPTLAGSITTWSGKAFSWFEKAGAEWSMIKASPEFQVVKGLAITAVKAEFPQEAGSLVDVDAAVEHTLDSLAAMSAVVKS